VPFRQNGVEAEVQSASEVQEAAGAQKPPSPVYPGSHEQRTMPESVTAQIAFGEQPPLFVAQAFDMAGVHVWPSPV
jgi:hypothetical protein